MSGVLHVICAVHLVCVSGAMPVVCAVYTACGSCMCHVLRLRVSMYTLKQERTEGLASKAKGSWNLSYLNPDHNCRLGTSKTTRSVLLHPKPAAICPLQQQVQPRDSVLWTVPLRVWLREEALLGKVETSSDPSILQSVSF